MKKPLFSLALLTVLIFASCNQQSKGDNTNNMNSSNISSADTTEIKALVEKYKQSIDNADTVLASKLWAHTAEVSFIHPRGHEHGWQEINNHIYKFFGDTFAKRKLNSYNEHVTVYSGDVAWTEFYWVFDATFKSDNSTLQTKGRESQIWRKMDNEWRLVHVHYSNMPVIIERKGF